MKSIRQLIANRVTVVTAAAALMMSPIISANVFAAETVGESSIVRNEVATASGKIVLKSGSEFNAILKTQAQDSNPSETSTDNKIKTITVSFQSSAPSWHSDSNKVSADGEAYAQYSNGTINIVCVGNKSDGVYANTDSSWMYSGLTALTNASFLSTIQYDDAESMAGMFYDDKSISSLDLSLIDMRNAYNISNMLDGMTGLSQIKTTKIYSVSPAYSMMSHDAATDLPGYYYDKNEPSVMYSELKYTVKGETWLYKRTDNPIISNGDNTLPKSTTQSTGQVARGGNTTTSTAGDGAYEKSGSTTIVGSAGTFGNGGKTATNQTTGTKVIVLPGGGGYFGGGAGFIGSKTVSSFSNKSMVTLDVFSGAGGSGYLNSKTVFDGVSYPVQDTKQESGVKSGDGQIQITFVGLGESAD